MITQYVGGYHVANKRDIHASWHTTAHPGDFVEELPDELPDKHSARLDRSSPTATYWILLEARELC